MSDSRRETKEPAGELRLKTAISPDELNWLCNVIERINKEYLTYKGGTLKEDEAKKLNCITSDKVTQILASNDISPIEVTNSDGLTTKSFAGGEKIEAADFPKAMQNSFVQLAKLLKSVWDEENLHCSKKHGLFSKPTTLLAKINKEGAKHHFWRLIGLANNSLQKNYFEPVAELKIEIPKKSSGISSTSSESIPTKKGKINYEAFERFVSAPPVKSRPAPSRP